MNRENGAHLDIDRLPDRYIDGVPLPQGDQVLHNQAVSPRRSPGLAQRARNYVAQATLFIGSFPGMFNPGTIQALPDYSTDTHISTTSQNADTETSPNLEVVFQSSIGANKLGFSDNGQEALATIGDMDKPGELIFYDMSNPAKPEIKQRLGVKGYGIPTAVTAVGDEGYYVQFSDPLLTSFDDHSSKVYFFGKTPTGTLEIQDSEGIVWNPANGVMYTVGSLAIIAENYPVKERGANNKTDFQPRVSIYSIIDRVNPTRVDKYSIDPINGVDGKVEYGFINSGYFDKEQRLLALALGRSHEGVAFFDVAGRIHPRNRVHIIDRYPPDIGNGFSLPYQVSFKNETSVVVTQDNAFLFPIPDKPQYNKYPVTIPIGFDIPNNINVLDTDLRGGYVATSSFADGSYNVTLSLPSEKGLEPKMSMKLSFPPETIEVRGNLLYAYGPRGITILRIPTQNAIYFPRLQKW